MTPSDVTAIEQALGITLPESYRRAVVPFRLRALAGNTDCQLWDDATRLIQLNQKLRAGTRTRPAWPPHLFAVGDPHGDELIALDTRSADGPVWWLDHGLVGSPASYRSHASFAGWAEEFYRDMRSDLTGDGLDPDAEPAAEEPKTGYSRLTGLLGYLLSMVGLALIGFVILLAIFWIKSWLKKH